MNQEEYLHEMKAIASIHKFLMDYDIEHGKREGDSAVHDLNQNLIKRSCKLLDYAYKYIPEEVEL